MSTIESLRFPGPAGPLEGILKLPPTSTSAVAHPADAPPFAAIVCHPHPLYGGTMHNKVVFHLAKALGELGAPVLRFNFRGVGASAGTHTAGVGERDDARAALAFLAARFPGVPLCVAGFSFGNWVGSAVGCGDERVAQIVAAGTPTRLFESSTLLTCTARKLFVQGEEDEWGPPAELEELFARVPDPKHLVVVRGADHFFTGHLDELRQAVADYFAAVGPPRALTQTLRERGPSNSQR